MRVMITGGGTGGHTSPAVAIIEELRERVPDAELVWVGKRGAIEERVSASAGIRFLPIPAAGWPRRRSPRQLWVLLILAAAILKALWLLLRFRPGVVVGVGGYVSLPLLWAAQRAGIKTVLHEQNKRLGMANRLLAPRASRLFFSYEDTIGNYPKDRAAVVGNPLRPGFLSPPDPVEARRTLGLAEGVPVILIVGGSQGAQSINDAVAGLVAGFERGEAAFLWMTGERGAQAAQEAAATARAELRVFPFIDDMVTACAAADLIVSRAGASSTAELAALGKPAILIPYPHATDNHQEQNARAIEAAGAAILLLDRDCTADALAALLRDLLADEARRGAMGHAASGLAKPHAADAVADVIVALACQPPPSTN